MIQNNRHYSNHLAVHGRAEAVRMGAMLSLASQTLETTSDLDEIKLIRDQAEAIRKCLKTAAQALDLRNRAAKIKLSAERRIGAFLASLTLRGGDRRSARPKNQSPLDSLNLSYAESARWQQEAAVPEDEFRRYVLQTTSQGKELSSRGLLRFARLHVRSAQESTNNEHPAARLNFKLHVLAQRHNKFACIYADPPWHELHQRRSTLLEHLRSLPIKAIAAPKSHLHLWVKPDFLATGLSVLRAWGYRYKSSLVLTKSPEGYGSYWHSAHDVLLLGTRGQLTFRDCGMSSWLSGRDVPPAILRSLLERASPAPYLDLFGVEPVSGWTMALLDT